MSRKNRISALVIVSQPCTDKLFKKREKKIAKNKTARAGDISFDKCQTLLPVFGKVIPTLIYLRFKLIGLFPTPSFRGDLFFDHGDGDNRSHDGDDGGENHDRNLFHPSFQTSQSVRA